MEATPSLWWFISPSLELLYLGAVDERREWTNHNNIIIIPTGYVAMQHHHSLPWWGEVHLSCSMAGLYTFPSLESSEEQETNKYTHKVQV